MEVIVTGDRAELGRLVAAKAANLLRQSLAEQDECNLVVATGSSQFEVLDQLVQQPDIDWSRVNGFHLDEYIGIDRGHSASFCGYLEQRFASKLPLKSFHFMDGTIAPDRLRQQACDAIRGKRIDLLLCGIGENGHLAFNDPPADFETGEPYLIVELDELCRKQQVGEGWFDSFEQVPTHAISMSVKQIMKAEHILCAVPDRRKAAAVQATVEGPVTEDVPASILRDHPSAALFLDSTSSSQLTDRGSETGEAIGSA
ncbi:MAG: glucosamine-6-phosphate deaminase [Planctomycetota bacterium]